MALEFPANPQEGERYTDPVSGVEYVYTGGKWTVDYISAGTVTSVTAVSPIVSDNDSKDPQISINEFALDLSLCDNSSSNFIDSIVADDPITLTGTNQIGLNQSGIDLSLCDNSTSLFLGSIIVTSPITLTGSNEIGLNEGEIDLSQCDNTTSSFITLADISYPVTSVNGQTGDVDLSSSFLPISGGEISGDLGVQGDLILPNLPTGPQSVPINGIYRDGDVIKVRLV